MKSKSQNPILKLLGIKVKPPNPIEWRYKVRRISFNRFQIHITAIIQHPYRLYSQESALEGPLPTSINFEESSFIHFVDAYKEEGNLKEEYSKLYKASISYYTSVVDYVQEIHAFLPNEVVKGKITYTPCTESHCLSTREEEFKIELSNQ